MPPISAMRALSRSAMRWDSRLKAAIRARISGALRGTSAMVSALPGRVMRSTACGQIAQRPRLAAHHQHRHHGYGKAQHAGPEARREAQHAEVQQAARGHHQGFPGLEPDLDLDRAGRDPGQRLHRPGKQLRGRLDAHAHLAPAERGEIAAQDELDHRRLVPGRLAASGRASETRTRRSVLLVARSSSGHCSLGMPSSSSTSAAA